MEFMENFNFHGEWPKFTENVMAVNLWIRLLPKHDAIFTETDQIVEIFKR